MCMCVYVYVWIIAGCFRKVFVCVSVDDNDTF